LEDAIATAAIFQKALAASARSVAEWVDAVERPITISSGKTVERAGAADGPFAGEVIVFTGSLVVSRHEAADEAARHGFDVAQGVTKKTTMVCVGIQDRDKIGGYEKSSKHRKAEELIQEGYEISIIGEQDFWRLIGRI
jgi:DNA polymerase III subunit epsilon